MLNFGGNVYAVGTKPDGSAYRVGVQDPDEPNSSIPTGLMSVTNSSSPIGVVSVIDRSVVKALQLTQENGYPALMILRDGTVMMNDLMKQWGYTSLR